MPDKFYVPAGPREYVVGFQTDKKIPHDQIPTRHKVKVVAWSMDCVLGEPIAHRGLSYETASPVLVDKLLSNFEYGIQTDDGTITMPSKADYPSEEGFAAEVVKVHGLYNREE